MVPQATLVKECVRKLLMKYTKIAIFCALVFSSNIFTLDDYSNHSFMFVRPVYDSVAINLASWHDIIFHKQKHGCAFQIYPIYEQSYPNLNNSGYFLFYHKNELTIKAGTPSDWTTAGEPTVVGPTEGQMSIESFNRDILGQWVGIYNSSDIAANQQNYNFRLNPTQRQGCVMMEVSQDLNRFSNHALFANWYLNLAVPIVWMENDLGITGNELALQAMDNPEFNFCRMTAGKQTSVRLTQASLTLGTRYMGEDDIHVIATTGVIIPLVEQDTNRSIFQPVQGFNSHFGLDTNVFFQFPICVKHEHSKSKILFFFDVHNNFLARNHQLRTYDIRSKPFSRYMQLFDSKTNELIPGMNALTLRSRVEPFMITNMATGFRLRHNDSFGEIGYELWAHGAERVTPEHKPEWYEGEYAQWTDNRYGIAFINSQGELAKIDSGTGNVVPLAPGEIGWTASGSNINYVSAPDGQAYCCPSPIPSFVQKNVYLKINDLDRKSPATQPTITHRAFASIGFGGKGTKRDSFANFGLFIEAAQNNAALCFWGGWFKAGMTF